MDGFAEKFTQRFTSAQDIINANGQAEATQVENLQAEVRTLLDTLEEKMGELGNITPQAPDTGKLENHIHKENVRVYRNVQASVTDELAKQTESLKEEFENQTELFSAMMETLNEQQKSQGEAIASMAVRMNEMETSVKRTVRRKAVLPLQIIILIVVLGELALNILLTLGYL